MQIIVPMDIRFLRIDFKRLVQMEATSEEKKKYCGNREGIREIKEKTMIQAFEKFWQNRGNEGRMNYKCEMKFVWKKSQEENLFNHT